jgi:hypothetical protein
MNLYGELYTALRRLPDTGPQGFEGLAVAVIQQFVPELSIRFLAKAGYQRGVDASSGGQASTWAGLECKHYQSGKCPPARELAGGLTLAINGSDDQLDAWLLVTTGAVDALSVAELKQAADREAVALVIIDWQQAGLPILGVLCAAAMTATIHELKNRVPILSVEAVRADLKGIRRDPAFPRLRKELRRQLSVAEIGFDHARNAANRWVAQNIRFADEARAKLGQPLCPLDGSFFGWIERPAIMSAIDTWYQEWPSSQSLAVIIGREGVGKSWAALKWWDSLAAKPLTLLITSNIDPAATDALDLMADQLTRQVGMGDHRKWRRRLERWLGSLGRPTPEVLFIFDGLNEQSRHDWAASFCCFSRPIADRPRRHPSNLLDGILVQPHWSTAAGGSLRAPDRGNCVQ